MFPRAWDGVVVGLVISGDGCSCGMRISLRKREEWGCLHFGGDSVEGCDPLREW